MKTDSNRCAIVIVALLIMPLSSALGQYYVIRDLGVITGPMSNAKGLDDTGRVVGQSMLASGNYHAALWEAGPIDLGTLELDTQSVALGINHSGAVVGVSYNYGDLQPHAFLWEAGSLTSIGNFSPRHINAAGIIVGHRMIFNAADLWVDQACRWTNGKLADLGTLGGHSSEAMASNASGIIVGQSLLADNLTTRACAWVDGVPHDLGTLAGTAQAKSAAFHVNAAGKVVGWSEVAGGELHACMFQVDAGGNVLQRTDLGFLANGSSVAFDINDADTVVGSSDYRGFVWESGQMRDLSTLIPPVQGWTITRATAINSNGAIAADGVLLGFTHAVLLSPVACLKGDVNGDQKVDGRDIQTFITVMIGGGTSQQVCSGDVAALYDGAVTLDDISAFVQCLLGDACG